MDSTLLVGGLLILAVLLVLAAIVWSRKKSTRTEKGDPILVFASRAKGPATFQTSLPEPLPPRVLVSAAPPMMAQAGPAHAAASESATNGVSVPTHPPATTPSEQWMQDAGVRQPAARVDTRPSMRDAGPRLVGTPLRVDPQQQTNGQEPSHDGTLQLLPGRIRIISGEGMGQEIRFVRVPGSPPEVSFGRSTGPAHRHVHLESPTVSRLHARLRFEGGSWILSNLSRTNPTRLNGQPMIGEPSEQLVHDGDRIEMGDVTMQFHQPETQDRLPFRSSWASEIGLRSTNQDAVAVRTLPGRREVAAVCDGIGSHQAGARASHAALETLVRALSEGLGLPEGYRAANLAVQKEAQADPSRKGMGTTMVAILREDTRYWVGNVGDSRAYRIDHEGIRQITNDHSFIAEAVRAGEMSKDEAERSPWRNAITRNLGAESEVEVDLFGEYSTLEPHIVVLCTDGLHGVISEEELEQTVRRTPDIRNVARALCEEAIRRGGKDNVSVAAMAFGGGIAGAAAAGSE